MHTSLVTALAFPAIVLAALAPAVARSAEDEGAAFKLTTGIYSLAGGGVPSALGLDVNLRHSSGYGNVWLGWYRSADQDVSQWRTGWDRTFKLGPVRVQPSVQAASGGFFGGSVYAETGEDWFAGAGLGRTNLRPYVNLNFDPNDAWTIAGGRRWDDGRVLTLMLVGDNRQNPDERHLHLVFRTPMGEGHRLTLDLLAKRGLVAGSLIHKAGVSVAYDWPRYFIRVAWDPKVNFTPQDMVRVSAGMRF